MSRITSRALAALTAPLLLSAFALADVHRVAADGSADFTTLQEAVDAANEGDTLLVAPGEYAAFTVLDKSLTVAAEGNADVRVVGLVELRDLEPDGLVFLRGLQVQGDRRDDTDEVALRVDNCRGFVHFVDCEFTGGLLAPTFSCQPFPSGADAVQLTGSTAVTFTRCELNGGHGLERCECGSFDCIGGEGGDACDADLSSVAFYDCVLRGGEGGIAAMIGGKGGRAYRSDNFGLFASGCTFEGGSGGVAYDFLFAWGGDGGDAIALGASAQAHLVDNEITGGEGGRAPVFPRNDGQPGMDVVGGNVTDYPGPARAFAAASFSGDGRTLSITVTGAPGDRVYVPRSNETGFLFLPAFSGVWTIPYPAMMPVAPSAVLPAGGQAVVDVQVDELPAGVGARLLFLQGYVIDASDEPQLGSPLPLLVVDCEALSPDCNANGEFDACDQTLPGYEDCDEDGVPDDCQPDCNANGTNDVCDVESGTSSDRNHNGIPDECEPTDQTWYVDAQAAAGGDGSLGAPFQTLAEAFSIALGGDRIRVRPGLYTGPANRNLEFGGRDLVVTSTNGPAATVLDLQGGGRAFLCRAQETPAAVIGGFTIRNGDASQAPAQVANGGGIAVWNASTTILNCVIEDCRAIVNGGGLYLAIGNSRVQGCTIRRCEVTGANAGGGVYAVSGATRLVACVIEDNTSANVAGGVYGVDTVTHCRIAGNTAASLGGGLYDVKTISNCEVVANTGNEGGGIAGSGTIRVWNSTVVGNTATSAGGGLHADFGSGATLGNSIVTLNTAPVGPQASVFTSGSGATLSVEYSIVEGGQAAVHVDPSSTLLWGTGNLDVDPLFLDADGPDDQLATWADNDYRLLAGSPALDSANNALLPLDVLDLDGDGNTTERVPFDLDIRTRRVDDPAPDTGAGAAPIVDRGAHERQ